MTVLILAAESGLVSKERFMVVSARVSPPATEVWGYPDNGLMPLDFVVMPLCGLPVLLKGLDFPVSGLIRGLSLFLPR